MHKFRELMKPADWRSIRKVNETSTLENGWYIAGVERLHNK
jgi:hypothetical protein